MALASAADNIAQMALAMAHDFGATTILRTKMWVRQKWGTRWGEVAIASALVWSPQTSNGDDHAPLLD